MQPDLRNLTFNASCECFCGGCPSVKASARISRRTASPPRTLRSRGERLLRTRVPNAASAGAPAPNMESMRASIHSPLQKAAQQLVRAQPAPERTLSILSWFSWVNGKNQLAAAVHGGDCSRSRRVFKR
jgi:hypothetical protein